MTSPSILHLAVLSLLVVFAPSQAGAQQHRAVRLGNPETRFAPPLKRPEDLRALLLNEKLKPDIVSILRQAQWEGNVEDLRRAAATAEITELNIAPGTRLPFMSARKNGAPVALMDVLWAGEEPVEAYAFEFLSKSRRYRCVTPKPCSNFLVVDLGLDPPKLQLLKESPAEASVCEPFEMKITVRNACTRPLTQVRITDSLPDGLKTIKNESRLDLDAGDLQPGEGMLFAFRVATAEPGSYVNRAEAVAAEGGYVEATARTVVRAPRLAINCAAPTQVPLKRPANVCLTVRNTGDATERAATVSMPVPAGTIVGTVTGGGATADANVRWVLTDIAPQATVQLCAEFVSDEPAELLFAPTATGDCSPAVETSCATRVVGVAGILLEVIDLEDPVMVGERVTYEIKVLNQGSATLTNLQLVCTLPQLQSFVSASGATPATALDRIVTMGPLAVLDPKASASWRVEVQALTAGDARFKAEISGDLYKQPVPEFEATQQY